MFRTKYSLLLLLTGVLIPLIPLVSTRRKILRSTRAKLLANSTFNLVEIQPHQVYYSNLRTMIPLAYLQTDQSLGLPTQLNPL